MKTLLLVTESNGWFARHNISPEWAAVLGAVFAAVATLIAVYLPDWLPSGKRRREELSRTLNEFAHVLLGMANDLEKGERPTQYGHRLNQLLIRLDDRTRKKIGKVALEQLLQLESLQDSAPTIHGIPEKHSALRSRWIHDARAIAGELQGIAANLR
jgi:hypothetical protein